MRIDVRRIEQLKNNKNEFIGARTRAKVVKNKVAPPFKTAEFDIMFVRGIAKEGEVLDAATQLDIIQKSGAWYSYGEQRLGQGRDNVKQYLLDHPDFMESLEKQIKQHDKELAEQAKASYKGGNYHKTPEEAKAADAKGTGSSKAPASAAAAKAQLDITVDDDE